MHALVARVLLVSGSAMPSASERDGHAVRRLPVTLLGLRGIPLPAIHSVADKVYMLQMAANGLEVVSHAAIIVSSPGVRRTLSRFHAPTTRGGFEIDLCDFGIGTTLPIADRPNCSVQVLCFALTKEGALSFIIDQQCLMRCAANLVPHRMTALLH